MFGPNWPVEAPSASRAPPGRNQAARPATKKRGVRILLASTYVDVTDGAPVKFGEAYWKRCHSPLALQCPQAHWASIPMALAGKSRTVSPAGSSEATVGSR